MVDASLCSVGDADERTGEFVPSEGDRGTADGPAVVATRDRLVLW